MTLKCCYCGHVGDESEFEEEHFVAHNTREMRKLNKLLDEKGIYAVLPDTMDVCHICNESKQDLSLGNWARWLRRHPEKLHPWNDGDRNWFVAWYGWLP